MLITSLAFMMSLGRRAYASGRKIRLFASAFLSFIHSANKTHRRPQRSLCLLEAAYDGLILSTLGDLLPYWYVNRRIFIIFFSEKIVKLMFSP